MPDAAQATRIESKRGQLERRVTRKDGCEMANLQSIHVNVQTGTDADADADGPIYLGFCGREFSIDSSADDFEKGSSKTYVFGNGHNVSNSSKNDPRSPQLKVENIEKNPVYIRMGTSDHWQLKRVTVTINGLLFPMWDTAELFGIEGKFWLGPTAGMILYIPKHED
jgi:hypothetical protein